MKKQIISVTVIGLIMGLSFTGITTTLSEAGTTEPDPEYLPDLYLVDCTVTEGVFPGWQWCWVTIKNIGSLDIDDPITIDLWISTCFVSDPPMCSLGPLGEIVLALGLQQGRQKTRIYRFEYNQSPYYHSKVHEIADPEDIYEEMSEDNNDDWSNWFPW